MGEIADAMYVQYMNQWRRCEELAPDPNGERILPGFVPTKWAVLQVLSKNCSMSSSAICALLAAMSYRRSKSSIRRALHRCLRFGFVVKEDYHKRETGVLKGKRNHRHAKWKLTERGRDVANTPLSKALKPKKRKLLAAAKETSEQANTQESSGGPDQGGVRREQRKVLGP